MTLSEIDIWKIIENIQIVQTNDYFNLANISKIILSGSYCFISSESIKQRDLIQNKKKFIELSSKLSDNNLPHRQVIGSYDGNITIYSYLVIKPNELTTKEFYRILFDLGQKYDQESIILSDNSIANLVFTSGSNIGKAYSANGYKESLDKNFSIVKCNNNDYVIIGQYDFDYEHLKDFI